ncbi:hypothetical protein [Rickettsia endosymbiont of Orchestes rusci]
MKITSLRGGIVTWMGLCCMATGIVIARRDVVPTWQSRKKLVQNAM